VLLFSTLNFCGYFRRREETSESSSLSSAKSLPYEREVSLHNSAYRDVILVRASKARSVKDTAYPDAAYISHREKPKMGMPTVDDNRNTTNPSSFSQDGNKVTLSLRVDGLSTHRLD